MEEYREKQNMNKFFLEHLSSLHTIFNIQITKLQWLL